jgi:hypothetical protein
MISELSAVLRDISALELLPWTKLLKVNRNELSNILKDQIEKHDTKKWLSLLVRFKSSKSFSLESRYFSQPVAEAEVPADVAREFDSGKPWPISGLVRYFPFRPLS